MKQYFVYIMSNKSRRLYVGITSKLLKRIFQHKNKLLPGFTARYNFDMLVYYEEFSQVVNAIAREKEIKGWRREKKLKLALKENPDWEDLSLEWEEDPSWKALPDAKPRPRLKRSSLRIDSSGADSSLRSE
jgi:putative endonuclease